MYSGTQTVRFTLEYSEHQLDMYQPVPTQYVIPATSSYLYAMLTTKHQTVSAICSFFLAMMCYPDAQAKAQAELDRVIGSERLPSLSDREQLPYIRALTWEVLRWKPIAPLGEHHRCAYDKRCVD